MLKPPYSTVLKPYGRALVDLAKERKDILCVTGDLTRQCEIDLFQGEIPERFIHAGMAEANMMSMAGALARRGYTPFVHTFGVFATRRPLDQIVNSIAYPSLPVRIVGFMPGISSPGGPSHQAIEDVALMRAIPNMTVVDLADATEIAKALPAIVDIEGPAYLRLKRGEIPVLFEDTHEFSLSQAQIVRHGRDAAVFGSGMMLSSAVAAADALEGAGVSVTVVNVPVIKPLDRATVAHVLAETPVAVTAENHSIIGGLGSAICEVAAEEGSGARISRVGLNDTFAEGARLAPPLFKKYGLSSQDIVDRVWALLGRADSAPAVAAVETAEGEYAPV